MSHLETPIQSTDDIRAELRAVESALAAAANKRDGIQQAINASGSIEQLGHLHDDWCRVNEDLTAARDRQAKLLKLLEVAN